MNDRVIVAKRARLVVVLDSPVLRRTLCLSRNWIHSQGHYAPREDNLQRVHQAARCHEALNGADDILGVTTPVAVAIGVG